VIRGPTIFDHEHEQEQESEKICPRIIQIGANDFLLLGFFGSIRVIHGLQSARLLAIYRNWRWMFLKKEGQFRLFSSSIFQVSSERF
jgi:hypothetical protein